METDSDSDGSHVSNTPPRQPNPPPPPPPQPKILPPTLLNSLKSSTKVESRSRAKVKKPAKPNTNQQEPPRETQVHTAFPTNLPFQIRRQVIPAPSTSAVDSLENVPAGFFSKQASFTKIRRSSLNFEDEESKPPLKPEVKNELVKKPKQPINLVTVEALLPPVKLRKCSGEGNFVKLNLNGNKRKFVNKGNKKRYIYQSTSGRKFYKKSRRKLNKKEADEEEEGEESFIVEAVQESLQKRKGVAGNLFDDALSAVREQVSDENLVRLLKLVYGYDSFRDGQLEAIKKLLNGQSTMLVLPTGAGKSMCYQLPAMVLPGLTLVVSPLVALMIDQLKQLPSCISGRILCSNQRPEEVAETMRLLQEGTIKVLFVSPERFLNAEFLSIFSSALSVSLVVVDEAHCISEWSHNFRPSYMRLRASLLTEKLNVECILAMTATATATTLQDVMSALEIPSSNLIQKGQLRDNLQLSVSLSGHNKMKDLLTLLNSSPFSEVQSIIIYCKFQFETDQISKYLCDYNISAKSYHSGLPAKDRTRVQELFCCNKINVVVATVAFGMGLDKSDVGAVIHYSLPESLEEYVQEIGRAGRDGRMSFCHLFFDDTTFFKIRSLAHSDGADEFAINKFLCQVFSDGQNSQAKLRSLVKESASRKFDLKEEVMVTLLTRLELGEVKYLRLLPQLNVTCTLNFHMTAATVLADKDIVVAAIMKCAEMKQGQYMFDIPTVANKIGWAAINVSNHLQNLKFKGEVTYELKDPAFCYTIVEIPRDLCSLSTHLTKWLSEVERCKVSKLDAMVNATVFALDACDRTHGCCGAQHTPCLQKTILGYFEGKSNCQVPNKIGFKSTFLRSDIKVFLQSNQHVKFTPRAVARIMHGIGSPAYPSSIWSKTHFWGRYTHIDFQSVMEAAKGELVNFVGKEAV